MAGVADSAVGAILEIPPEALNKIASADRAIQALGKSSWNAANAVKTHWGVTAVEGLDKFIAALAKAKGKMDELGAVNIKVNTGAAQSEMSLLTSTITNDVSTISRSLQDLALGKVNFSSVLEQAETMGLLFEDVKKKIENLKNGLDTQKVTGVEGQATVNELRQWEELLRVMKMANEEKNKALGKIAATQQNKEDKEYLNEQKRLLANIFDLRKQINAQSLVVARGRITGDENLKTEEDALRKLVMRYQDATKELNNLDASKISDKATTDAKNASLKNENALIKEQLDYRQKMISTINRANELTASTQAGKTRLGNADEAAIQRQLNSDYKEMLRILREQGELKAKVASEGRQMNQSEINLIATLEQRYKLYYDDIQRVAGAYMNLAAASQKSFETDRSAQLARNAVLLADAQNKAEQNAQKAAEAQAKADEKAIAAGEKIIAQKEAQIKKEQDAKNAAAQAEYLNAINRELAAKESVNKILEQRIALQQKISALETKVSIAGLKDPTATMSFADTTKLQNYEAQMKKLEDDLKVIALNYGQLARDSQAAFDAEKVNILALSVQKVAEAQAQLSASSRSTKASSAEDELTRLYSTRLKLMKEIETINNRGLLRNAKDPSQSITAQENQLLAELNKKLKDNESSINRIGNTYHGLKLKVENAFNLDVLRQNIDLQNKFNTSLNSINTSKTKELVEEYKRLYNENQKIQSALDKFASIPVGTASSSVYASANALFAQQAQVLNQMHSLEQRNIQEITNFRIQKDMEANQRSISEFIQAEAQKTAEAKKQADIQSQNRIAAYQKYLNTYQGAMAAYNKLGTRGGNYADTYENRERIIKNLETAIKSLDKADSDYKNKLDVLTTALYKLKEAQKAVSDAMKPSKPMISPQDAINAAKNATTLKDLEKAYKQLKEVMATTNPKSSDWAAMNAQLKLTKEQIDKIKKAMGEFRSETNRSANSLGQVKGLIAGAFSVSAIKGFLKKMVEVRAQFELQQVALRAIIRDKDEADRIFSQIQNMALQSPFTIMQLTTYSKQLAAYNIEAEKLVDTTKMLADVSAGLGVDFGRLSLAFGQVRSANYLRATELRQFTEAGLNMGKELADYYSDIEKRTVSIGDVMDMISKRMVRFEDVEEVFRRVTSAGGMFYDMQKKQSESLHGQIQRISDAYSIMMNDIGKSNESTIGKALTLIRAMISHWRIIVPLIEKIGVLMAAIFIPRTILAVVGAVKTLNLALATTLQNLKWISNASKFASMLTGFGAVIAVATVVFSVFQGLKEEANALNEELSRIGGEATNDMRDSIANFLTLAKVVTDTSKSYAEQKDALDNLVSGYGEYIDKQKLTSDYLTKLQGDYSELTAEIRRHYAEIEYQNKMDAISNSQQFKDAQKQMREVGERMFNEGIFDESVSKKAVEQWMDVITQELASGKLENSTQAIAHRMSKIFGDSMGDIYRYMSESIGKADLTDMVDKVNPMVDAIDNLSLSTIGAANHQEALNNSLADMPLETASRQYEKLADSIKQYQDKIATEQNWQLEQKYDPLVSQQAIDESNQKIAEYQSRIEQLKQQQLELNDIIATKLGETVYDEVNNGALEFSIRVGDNTEKLTLNNTKLKEQLMAYFNLAKEIRDVKATGEKYDGQLAELEKQQEDCWLSTRKMAVALGVDLKRDTLDAARTIFDFNTIINKVSTKALPRFLEAAIKAFSEPKLALLGLEKHFVHFAKKVNSMFGVEIFDGVTSWADSVDKRYADMLAEMAKKAEDAANQQADSLESFNDKIQKDIASDFGVDASFFNKYVKSQTESTKQYADGLRKSAAEMSNEYKSYQKAVQKGTEEAFLKNNNRTKAELERLGKEAEALEEYADRLYPKLDKEKKGGKGTDPWQKRVQLFKELNTEYEKLLQNYSEEESKQRIQKSYAQAIAEIYKGQGKFGNAESWMGFDKATMIKIGQEMLDTLQISPEKRKELEKQIASMKAEVDIQIQKDAVDNMKNQMQKVADNFELSETFRKLGVSTDMVFMLGGKPTTLEEYKQTLINTYEDSYKIQQLYGAEGVKAYDEILKKIEEKENKSLEERAKNYAKYLGNAYGDSAKVMLDYYTKLTEMNEDFSKYQEQLKIELASPETSEKDKERISSILENLPEQAKRAGQKMREEMDKELSKLTLDKVLKSPLFSEMFQELGSLSNSVLDRMITKINEIRDGSENLSLSQVRQLAQYAEKLENAKINNSPFKEAVNAIQKAYELRSKGITAQSANDVLAVSEEELSRLETLKEDIQLVLGFKEKSYKIEGDAVIAGNEQIVLTEQQKNLTKQTTSELNKQLDATEASISKQNKIVTANAQNVQIFKNAQTATEKFGAALQEVAKVGQEAMNVITAGIQMFGGEISESDQVWVDFVGNMLSTCITLGIAFVALGIEINSALGIIGLIATALSAVASLFTAIFQSHDKKLEKQIKKVQDRVDDLSRAFDKLKTAIDNAFSFNSAKVNTDLAIANAQQQIKGYQEMIRLEEDKKKTDKDKIKEYKEAIEDLQDEIKELKKQKIEIFGGFGLEENIKSAAEEFADVWTDAYMETGDGLDALQDKFQEFALNMLKKQVWGRLAEKFINPILTSIDNAFNADGSMNVAKWNDIVNNLKDINLEQFNEYAKQLAESLGFKPGGEFVLSDLQKGIQNITEPQAAAIEAYLNSMRFAVFRHTEQLDQLIAAVNAQYGSAESPVVTELKGIRSVLGDIYTTLKSVITSKVGAGAAVRIM